MTTIPLLILIICCPLIRANLVLTYPQARFPPLDFLPSEITSAPCGVPKPMKTFYTNFDIGESYEVTWIPTTMGKNSTYRIRIIDSDGLTIQNISTSDSKSSKINPTTPCEQCMLLVEQITSTGKIFKTCADINILKKGAVKEEACNQRGTKMQNGICQCEIGYTGEKCEHYAHCSVDEDCLNGGKCVDQEDSLIRKKCYCSYGFFGQRCDRKFNAQNDLCFGYDDLNALDLPRFGMFNPKCYVRHDLSADDQLYSRRVENEIELILDFKTSSWLSLGWRPTQLSTSCRLFPVLEDVRKNARVLENDGGEEEEEEETDRRHFVAKPIMPKNNGFTDLGLKAPLHAMDCVDMIMASVKDGRIFISDYYSRDRSTPLEDYWYDGEMSLSAAYGLEVDGRTLVMFRRDIREIEPTDHPLGPNDLFVLWAKGENMFGDDFKYHGNNRGIEQLNLSQVVNLTFVGNEPKSNDVQAFGVKNQNDIQEHLIPMSTPAPKPKSAENTGSGEIIDENSAFSHRTISIFVLILAMFL
ncbi:unnamed protein product [Caenorhabditis angaria]|uniref:EGF-like domain-containing protein n=1 Tax=Caenorhabditis angaria TaxID=860376 RepID=A0A9P1MUJ1_9PELO|nr:unnamed protein product [Caenorhabditis angaria]